MMRLAATLVAIVMVAAMAGCSNDAGILASSKKIVAAGLFLTPTGDISNPCGAKAVPSRIQVKKNEDIEWTIVDLCGGTKGYTIDVELRFTGATTKCDGKDSPLDPAGGEPKDKKNIKRGINSKCDNDTIYPYQVWLAGGASPLADPDVEIVQ
jgi:hypothetical protein